MQAQRDNESKEDSKRVNIFKCTSSKVENQPYNPIKFHGYCMLPHHFISPHHEPWAGSLPIVVWGDNGSCRAHPMPFNMSLPTDNRRQMVLPEQREIEDS